MERDRTVKIVEYADRDMAAIDIANTLASDLETALLHHETVSFAVPGGTTPGVIFDSLCAADLDWARITVLPTDERWVAPDDARSNAGLIRQRLLSARAAKARFLSLYAPAQQPETVLEGIAARVKPHLPLSVLLLGMGADMHTASLFPDAPGLAQALSGTAPPVVALRPENQPETRVSLTFRALNGALSKHLVIFGKEKRDALERALTLPPEEAPIGAVLSGAVVHWAP